MAKSLQVEVIAQGVESQEQIAFLEEQDIQLAQGYFLSDPLQANEIPQLLEQTRPDDSWRI
jgi:EAL domain-containing protein (putative c-di-GMP-specific phosphodiesterase class I)